MPGSLLMAPAGAREKRLTVNVLLVTGLVFLVTTPFSSRHMDQFPLFLPIYQSALILCDVITSTLLIGQFKVSQSRAILLIVGGYAFSAMMGMYHLLTFPGLFSDIGLLGSNEQTTAWLYFLWHLGLPVAVIGYALGEKHQAPRATEYRSDALVISGTFVLAFLLATAALLLSTSGGHLLPAIMSGDEDRPAKYAVATATWVVTLMALPALWRRRPFSILDLWLIVVISASLCDVAQAAVFNDGRYSFGWYTGRIYGLGAASFLLIMLIIENNRLYVRLASAYQAEHDQRLRAESNTRKLNDLNETLEERVTERTAELESSNRLLLQTREELRELGAIASTAREQERARLARDIHDELGQVIALLKIEVSELEQSLSEGTADILPVIDRMQELIDITLETSKRIAANLRPDLLDILGFAEALESMVSRFSVHQGITCRLHIDPPELSLTDPWATVVYRVVQEALTNIARHAGATRIDIVLSMAADEIRLTVHDNGKDFDTSAPRASSAYGLSAMRERIYVVSGDLRIDSVPGEGTTISVNIPGVEKGMAPEIAPGQG